MKCDSLFQTRVSRNPDLARLAEKGYAIDVDGGYLVVRDIPYLGPEGALRIGAIVTKLVFVDQDRVRQEDHQIFFAGSHPHNIDGSAIRNLGGGGCTLTLSKAFEDVVVERSFSNKPVPPDVFADFFEKIESYVGIISGPAMHAHGATPYTFRRFIDVPSDSPFKLQDTLTSRAEIAELGDKFRDEVVALIGLGGTGAYLLDYLVKTPAKEIRGFDVDDFHVHNAFRSPGHLALEELGRKKADVYATRYENFRHGLRLTAKAIDETSLAELDGVTFAFVCVDKGSSRSRIFDLLIAKAIPFIDAGMGLQRAADGSLKGMMRLTYYPAHDAARIRAMNLAEMVDPPDGIYRTNIQIAELNAMNASLAMIRYKQLRGFYSAQEAYNHLLLDIVDLKTVGSQL
jgi:ThiF family